MAMFLVAAFARADEIQVTVAGRESRSMDAYRIGAVYYLSASQAATLYQAQSYWKPMSETAMLSLRGQRVEMKAESDKARIGERSVALAHPMIVRTGQPFVPIDLFTTEEFAEASGYETRFHPESKVMTVERRITVGPVQWFSFGDRSQVVIPLRAGMNYTASKRGRSGVRVEIPFGRADASARMSIGDGVLHALELDQQPSFNPKAVRVTIELEPGVEFWEKVEQEQPRRLVLNFFKSRKALEAFRNGTPTPVTSAPSRNMRSGTAGEENGLPAAKAGAQDRPGLDSGLRRNDKAAPAVVTTPAASPVVSEENAPAPTPPASSRKRRIVVDAGHGGKDKGTTGIHRIFEKDINLLVARDLAQKLRDSGKFEVLMTRTEDTFVPLGRRSKMANDFQADLFISLHCNNTNHRGERGFEIYFLSEKASDPESQRVADVENAVLALEGKSAEQETAAMLLQAMAKTEFMNDAAELAGLMTKELPRKVDLKDRGVKQAAFYVLRGTNAPAVLVEMGFLSNSGDEARLATKKFRKRLVEGLYEGIFDFAKRRHWKVD